MTKLRPTKLIGFDTDHVESWDYIPETKESQFAGIATPCLVLNFISGQTKRLYGEAATEAYEVLCDQSIALFKEPS